MGVEEQPRVGIYERFATHTKKNKVNGIRVGQRESLPLKGGDAPMNSVKRSFNNNYLDMTEAFDSLYSSSQKGMKFHNLMEIIRQKENILLALRNIRANKGSKTAGTDGYTIDDILKLPEERLIAMVRRQLNNYQPKSVRRVEIPKPNGKLRPLGIPCILDRIIQQSIYQVLNPICEAKFMEYSNGFRPLRSAHTAMAQVYKMVQRSNLHYVVSIDIKGFFDNVNHNKLMKQLWTMGIRDKELLVVIRKMLEAEIQLPDGKIEKPTKGTPQGGILSPLLSNIVLNELDWWISSQWLTFRTKHDYTNRTYKSGTVDQSNKYKQLRGKSKLKEVYIVRYADDFLLFCRDYETARKIYHSTKQWIEERLKLEINEEKSKIIDLKAKYAEYLGFEFKVREKSGKYTIKSHISKKNKAAIKVNMNNHLKGIQKPKDKKDSNAKIQRLNAYIIGIHNYYRCATEVYFDLRDINYSTYKRCISSLKQRFRKPSDADKENYDYKRHPVIKLYGNSRQIRLIDGQPLAPIGYIKNRAPLFKVAAQNVYTPSGRMAIHDSKGIDTSVLIALMKMDRTERSVQYVNNRISRFAAQNGKCAILQKPLQAHEVHCHHKIPTNMGGNDSYENLTIVHENIHRLIHATNQETIEKYCMSLKLTASQLKKVNELRNKAELPAIA